MKAPIDHNTAISNLLNHLIDESAPLEGEARVDPEATKGFSAQLHFRDGRFVAGFVSKHAAIDGIFRFYTVGQAKDQNGQSAGQIIVVMLFTADSILHIDLMLAGQKREPSIVTPSGSRIIPGRIS